MSSTASVQLSRMRTIDSAGVKPVSRSGPALRMTRRGRALLLVVLIALLLGAFAAGRSASNAADPASPAVAAPALRQTTVAPGETLWGVARRVAPARDPREIVAQLERLNHLPSGQLQAGQQLVLPARAA